MIRACRGNKVYLYHSEWRNGRAVKTYLGSGPVAEAAAAEIEAHRLLKRQQREAERAAEAQIGQAVEVANLFAQKCELVAAATLIAAGFHRPNYKAWRRRRVRHDHDQG